MTRKKFEKAKKKQRVNEKYSEMKENNREFDINKRAGSQSDILIRLAVIYINYWNYYKEAVKNLVSMGK